MRYINILKSDFTLPTDKVCILAPGPNGKDWYSKIPEDFYIIAVSKAVLIPGIKADIWMMNHANQDWFDEANKAFNGICVFGEMAVNAAPSLSGKKACYYYEPSPERLEENFLWPIDGVIRYGATISGCAIQLAYNLGASEILLCGVDLSGEQYWDGSTNSHPDHVEVWPAVYSLNPLIRWMREDKNMKISTLSLTKLDLPRYMGNDSVKENEGYLTKEQAREINDIFPHQVCINLDRRSDRWERMQARFNRHRIGPVERFAAFDGNNLGVALPSGWEWTTGQYGCLLSHQEVVKIAREKGYPNILIYEDDVDFDPDFNAKFSRYIEELPKDWDFLLFGGIHQDEPIKVSDHVYRLTRTNSAHAYVLRETIYDAFIDLNDRAPDSIDTNVTLLQKKFNCYSFIPHIAWVAADFSDTRYKKVNAGWLKESLILNGKEMDEILENTVFILSYSRKDKDEAWVHGSNFVIHHYGRHFPQSSILVVEQDQEPSLDPKQLPANVRYEFVEQTNAAKRDGAFNRGIRLFGDKVFFVFADSDVYLPHRDIRANLMMGKRYDVVNGFENIFNLTTEDSYRLLEGIGRVDFTRYNPEPSELCTGYCVFTKKAIEYIKNWNQDEKAQSLQLKKALTIFESPNPAMRIFNT